MTPEERERLRAVIEMMMAQQEGGPASDQLLNMMGRQADQLPANSIPASGGVIPQYAPIQPQGPQQPPMMSVPGSFPAMGVQVPHPGGGQAMPNVPMGPPVPPEAPDLGFTGGSGYGGIGGGTLDFPPTRIGGLNPEQQAIMAARDAPAPGDPGFVGPVQPPPRSDYGEAGVWPWELPMEFPLAPSGGAPPAPAAPGADSSGITVGPFPEELPPPPEQPGDLARARAGQSLDQLRALRDIGEGFGQAKVVTTGDVIHRTAKGMGTDRPYRAEGTRADIAAREALELEDRKQAGRREIAGIGAGGYGGLTEVQQKQMITERGQWRSNVRIRKIQEAADAADGLLTMIDQPGSIAHQMAARQLLAASGEERYSEQDIKGVLSRAGVIQSTWDAIVRTTTGNMNDWLRSEYKKVATEMRDTKRKELIRSARESAKGFSKLSGVPVDRVMEEAYNIDPDTPMSGEYWIEDTTTGVKHPATRDEWEEAATAGTRFRQAKGP